MDLWAVWGRSVILFMSSILALLQLGTLSAMLTLPGLPYSLLPSKLASSSCIPLEELGRPRSESDHGGLATWPVSESSCFFFFVLNDRLFGFFEDCCSSPVPSLQSDGELLRTAMEPIKPLMTRFKHSRLCYWSTQFLHGQLYKSSEPWCSHHRPHTVEEIWSRFYSRFHHEKSVSWALTVEYWTKDKSQWQMVLVNKVNVNYIVLHKTIHIGFVYFLDISNLILVIYF